MQVKLKVLGGAHEGKEIIVKDEKFLIGRSDSCQLRPKSDSVSRKHCVIVQKEGRVLVADLRSRNGTLINGIRLDAEKAKSLKPNDVLQVGQLQFEVMIEHGLGGAKKPEVANVKEAAARIAEDSATSEPNSDFVNIADWLIEADMVDRGSKRTPVLEPETRMLSLDETTNINLENSEQEPEEDSKMVRADKKAPIKMPKYKTGPATQNSKSAAEQTLKKFFGGR